MGTRKLQLCFIWTNDGIEPEGVGFNIMPNIRYELKYDGKKYHLIVASTHDYLKSLYGDKITSLTGIVGKNGSGKTSFLKFLNTNFAKITHFGTGHFAVWKNKNEKYFYTCNFLDENIDIPQNTICKEILKLSDENIEYPTVIFTSNIFDGRLEEEKNYGTKDLIKVINKSLNKEINDFLEIGHNTTEYRRKVKKGIIETEVINKAISLMKDYEEFREIMKKDISFMPNALQINVKDINEDFFKKLGLEEEYNYIKNNSYKRYYLSEKRLKALCGDNFPIINERRCSFEGSLTCLAISIWIIIIRFLKSRELSTEKFDNYINDAIDNIDPNKNSVELLLYCFDGIDRLTKELTLIKDFLEHIHSIFIYENAIGAEFHNELFVKFDKYKREDKALLLYDLVLKVSELVNSDVEQLDVQLSYYVSKDIRCGYSTGQLMRFRLFINIYEAIVKDENDGFILLIDEWDLYLHPEWQRHGIWELVTIINSIKKISSCQIILTSNSPFLLSDIPSQNVIFMEEGKVKDKNVQTFGQNIHTLLKDSFFMESTIGEFTKEKISECFKYLKDIEEKGVQSSYYDKQDFIKQIINVTGDILIKSQLEKLYYKCFNDEEARENELIKCREEIAKLNRKINDNIVVDKNNLASLKLELESLLKSVKEIEDNANDKN